MSDDHHLPDDPAQWPRDPYRLLGVERGAEARAIKRAYHRLIRRFKPEHHPDEFRLIREAFEATERGGLGGSVLADLLGSSLGRPEPRETADGPIVPEETPDAWPAEVDDEGGAAPAEVPQDETQPTRAARPEEPDLWALAVAGEVEPAYRGLLAAWERGRRAEAVALQLHWLLVTGPDLDPTRSPEDWLVAGALACGSGAGRLRELLRRAAEADPAGALDGWSDRLMAERTPLDLVLLAADWRWRAARRLRRWEAITRDVRALRGWLAEVAVAAWVRLLLLAAENIAWAGGTVRDERTGYRREAEELADAHALDIEAELGRFELAEAVAAGINQRGWDGITAGGLPDLLRCHWDRRGPDFRPSLIAFARQATASRDAGLNRFDALGRVAPAALGVLAGFLGDEAGDWPEPPAVYAVVSFLATVDWSGYDRFRPGLLLFCRRERLDPSTVARALDDRPGFVLPGHLPLALRIATDWPLHAAYRADALARE